MPTLLLLVTYKIIFQPGSSSPTLPLLILRPRFCCGLKTVLTCKISFNLSKSQCRGENFHSVLPPHRIFFNASSFNRLLNIFLIPLLIDLLRTRAISSWGRVGEVPPPHLVMPFVKWQPSSQFVDQRHAISAWFPFTVPSHVKEKKMLFTIRNFKFTYVQANRIYMKVTSCTWVGPLLSEFCGTW